MPIEVRQLVIKSTAGEAAAPRAQAALPAEPPTAWRERLRDEVMAECKAWVEERLQRARER